MQQPIVGYHLDDAGDRVAKLACGHNQHVRHDPPWINRPWTQTEAGRTAALGRLLECRKCDRGAPRDWMPREVVRRQAAGLPLPWGSPSSRAAPMSSRAVRLHRVLRAKPEKVYRAFLEPDAMAKWLPPYGFTCKVHHLDARVGGTFRMSFSNFSSGNGHSFGGEYLELVPNERLRYTDKFDDPNLPGVLQVEVVLKPVLVGTEVSIVQEGIPEMIPLEMCYLGWQESLAQLATLVEPEIPG